LSSYRFLFSLSFSPQADRFLEKKAERDNLRVQHALFSIYALDSRISHQEYKREEAQGRLSATQETEKSLDAKLAELSKTLSKLHKDLATKEKQASNAARASVKAGSEAEGFSQDIQSFERRIKELTHRIKDLSREEETRQSEIVSLKEEIDSLTAELAALEAAASGEASADGDAGGAGAGAGGKKGSKKGSSSAGEKGSAQSLSAANKAEYNRLKGVQSQKTSEVRSEVDKATRQKDESEAIMARLEPTITDAESKLARLQKQSSDAAARRAALAKGEETVQQSLNDLVKQRDDAKARMEADQARLAQVEIELQRVKEVLQASSDKLHKSEKQRELLETVDDLKRLFPLVRGRLADLVDPVSKQYNLALTVALGKHLDSIVCAGEQTALECIRHLHEHRKPPMTFIALDRVKVEELDDTTMASIHGASSSGGGAGAGGKKGGSSSSTGVFRMARDIARFDPEIEKAILYACGTTVIADSIQDGMRLRYDRDVRVKIVTLDGSVIAKNGNMTGGTATGAAASEMLGKSVGSGGSGTIFDEKEARRALEAKDELAKEEAILKRRLAKTSRGVGDGGISTGGAGAGGDGSGSGLSLSSWSAAIDSLDSQIKNHSNKLMIVRGDLAFLDKTVSDNAKEVSNIKKILAAQKPEYDAAKKQHSEALAKIEELQRKADDVAEEVFKEFCASLGLKSVKELETHVIAKEEAERKRRAALNDNINRLKSKLNYLQSNDTASRIKEAQQSLNKAQSDVADCKKKEKEALKVVEESKAEVEAANKEVAEMRKQVKEAEQQREAASKEKKKAVDDRAAAAKAVSLVDAALGRLRSQRHDLLVTAQMEEIKLPMKKGASSSSSASDGEEEEEEGAGAGAGGKKGKKAAATKNKGKNNKKKGKKMDVDGEEDEDSDPSGDTDDDEEEEEDGPSPPQKDSTGKGGVFSKAYPSATTASTDGDGSGAALRQQHREEREKADQRRTDRIDFSSLDAEYRRQAEHSVTDPAVEEQVSAKFEARIHSMNQELSRMTPNLKAGAQLEEVDARLAKENAEVQNAQRKVADLEARYHRARQLRIGLLFKAFESAERVISHIYKDLTRSTLHPDGGSATLVLNSEEEPFESDDAGISYTVMPPGKAYREMQLLSGGEKTQAALALIFALHAFRPSPFLVMDEVDAALDANNVQRVAAYIRKRTLNPGSGAMMSGSGGLSLMGGGAGAGAAGGKKKGGRASLGGSSAGAGGGDAVDGLSESLQAIVISLKPRFFEQAEGLVGIYQDQKKESSGSLTVDLTQFPPAPHVASGVSIAGTGTASRAGSLYGGGGAGQKAGSIVSGAGSSRASTVGGR
jgi:structural maintenance of chromosome 1